jgi:D-3-phosphoglycerate dehydrogenase
VLCIVGYGHVGSQLSVLAEAMGMKVQFYDVVPKLTLGLAAAKDSLEEALDGADFVSLHVPATEQTQGLVGAQQLARMKKGAFLINAARGSVVDLDAVAAALKSGQLGGAAIDVFEEEPADGNEPFNCPLIGLPNVILTPHIGGSTEEAQVAIGVEVASKMVQFINSGASVGAVNLPELSLPPHPTTHRVLNIHANVPGVLRDVNHVLSDYNVVAQLLMTKGPVGYLIVDVERGVSGEIKAKIALLKNSIKTRLLY